MSQVVWRGQRIKSHLELFYVNQTNDEF